MLDKFIKIINDEVILELYKTKPQEIGRVCEEILSQNITNITNINLGSTNLIDENILALLIRVIDKNKIKELTLTAINISPGCFNNLFTILANQNTTEKLDISFNDFRTIPLSDFITLKNLLKNSSNLKSFASSNLKLNPGQIQLLFEGLSYNKSIEELHLLFNDFNEFNTETKFISEFLENNSSLKKLYLGNTRFSEQTFNNLFNGLKLNKSIHTIDFSKIDLTNLSINNLNLFKSFLANNRFIQTIHFSNAKFNENSFNALFEGFTLNKSINALDFRNIDFTTLSINNLNLFKSFLANNRFIQIIYFSNAKFNENSFNALFEGLEKNEIIRVVKFANDELNEDNKSRLNRILDRNKQIQSNAYYYAFNIFMYLKNKHKHHILPSNELFSLPLELQVKILNLSTPNQKDFDCYREIITKAVQQQKSNKQLGD